jgi:hypothetical protein
MMNSLPMKKMMKCLVNIFTSRLVVLMASLLQMEALRSASSNAVRSLREEIQKDT